MSETAHSKFICAGEKLYAELGYRKLSVRVLAAEAGLSSGMFHHLFANKDAFVLEMLQNKNNVIQKNINQAALPHNPFEKLAAMEKVLAISVRDNLDLVNRVLADSADGVEVINQFIRQTMAQRMALFTGVLEECAKLDNSVPAATLQRLAYFASSVTAPMVVASRFKKMGLLSDEMVAEMPAIFTDEAIEQRIRMGIAAMFPRYQQIDIADSLNF